MKSLQDIFDALEKRSPIPGAPFTVTNDGVYFLQSNLVCSGPGLSGITIGAGVKVAVIDLRGFSLSGQPGTSHGVNVTGSNAIVRIANGQISGFGGNGINSVDSSDTIETLTIQNCAGRGVVAGPRSRLRDVVVRFNGLHGVETGPESECATVQSDTNGGDGLMCGSSSRVWRCRAARNGGAGLRLADRCDSVDNDCNGNTGDNLVAGNECRVENCRVQQSLAGSGLVAGQRCVVKGVFSISNAVDALSVADDCSLADTRGESSSGRLLAAGANLIAQNLILTGRVATATVVVRGGAVSLRDSVVFTPGVFRVGPEVTVTAVYGWRCRLATSAFVITNINPQVVVDVTLRDSAVRCEPGNLTSLGRPTVSGCTLDFTSTNCSSLVYCVGLSGGIIEETEFKGSGLEVTANSIVRRCIFTDLCGEYALRTAQNCLVESCTFSKVYDPSGTGGSGLRAGTNSIVRNCTVMDCERDGIVLEDRALAMNNNVCNVGLKPGVVNGSAINVLGALSLVDGNLCTKSDVGINLIGTGNTIIRNKVAGNTSTILGFAGNDVGPLSSAATAANPFSNFP